MQDGASQQTVDFACDSKVHKTFHKVLALHQSTRLTYLYVTQQGDHDAGSIDRNHLKDKLLCPAKVMGRCYTLAYNLNLLNSCHSIHWEVT